jgi:hypothetical protein
MRTSYQPANHWTRSAETGRLKSASDDTASSGSSTQSRGQSTNKDAAETSRDVSGNPRSSTDGSQAQQRLDSQNIVTGDSVDLPTSRSSSPSGESDPYQSPSDSDSGDENMATNALMPSHFHGLTSEDAEAWWRVSRSHHREHPLKLMSFTNYE